MQPIGSDKAANAAIEYSAANQKNTTGSYWCAGLMTGTVLDGNIDVALLKTDGHSVDAFGHYTLAPYQSQTVDNLRRCQELAMTWQFNGPQPRLFSQTARQLTLEQSAAVKHLLTLNAIDAAAVRVIGFHGQTVLHRPPADGEHGKTCQLGDGALMARTLGIDVVNDFRQADMRAGGQGAPLSAIYHQALLRRLRTDGELAVLNLGGVANLTWWDGKDKLAAFDTGPANAPINDFVRQSGAGDYDVDGQLAATGCVDELELAQLLEHPYFSQPYPKSLDRCDFSWQMAQGCALADGAALLSAFCAGAVAKALDLLPQRPQKLLVCGGGRHNPSLMREIAQRAGVTVEPVESVGWRGDAIEAECFAYLAMRTLRGLPSSFPQTTGTASALCAGTVHLAEGST